MSPLVILVFLTCASFTWSATLLPNEESKHFPDECPEISDTIELSAGPWEASLNPLLEFHNGSHFQSAKIDGLSGLNFSGHMNLAMGLTLRYFSPLVTMSAEGYEMSGYLDFRPLTFLPMGNFTGRGIASASFRNLEIHLNTQISILLPNNTIIARYLDIDELRFDEVCFNFGPDFNTGDSPVDWESLCQDFKSNFDQEWSITSVREELTEKFRLALNSVLKVRGEEILFFLMYCTGITCC